MKTRFDLRGVWFDYRGVQLSVSDMETVHIMNTAKMLLTKPDRTLAMLITDIENATFSETVWTPFNKDDRFASLRNATSMTADELRAYVQQTPLFQSLVEEMTRRGVNVENVLALSDSPGA